MWETLLDRLLTGLITTERLTITYPSGLSRDYGPQAGKPVHMAILDKATLRHLVLNPELALGEAYMDGRIALRAGTILDLLKCLVRNRNEGQMPSWVRLADRTRFQIRRFLQHNAPGAARRNVAHHYDISDDLYRLFLDDDMQYSCAYFTDDTMSLRDAQIAKKEHIAQKLLLEPGMHVLDIGCGWGGMALTLARDHGVRVTGITLSENQLATARARAAKAGLADRIRFELMDYRHIKGPFDRIVSVGMFEHVGVPNYQTYFDTISDLLTPDGIALIHTIGRSAPPMGASSWIHKYIFPGGYVPSLSEIATPLERSGLWQSDIEVWRMHYAKTLRAWLTAFEEKAETVNQMYDARFVKMFRYYLCACITGFEDQHQCVYHLQLAQKRDTVPITRNYLYSQSEYDSQTKLAAE
jgi:cyclopropane-fatty-acyl-phospholipid synthase